MRLGSMFWGITLLIFGSLLLLNNLGIISVNVWGIFPALFLIFIGAWILFGRLIFRQKHKEENISIPLENAYEAKVTISHGAGRLNIQGNPGSNELVSGTILGGVDINIDRKGEVLKAHLEASRDWFFGIPPADWEHSRDWQLYLTDQIPIKLKIRTGASQSEINLQELKISELNISTGASQSTIILPARAGLTEVKLESGAADTQLKIPEGVHARIRYSGGLAKCTIDENRFPGGNNLYQSLGYDTAQNRVNIQIDLGVGSVSVV